MIRTLALVALLGACAASTQTVVDGPTPVASVAPLPTVSSAPSASSSTPSASSDDPASRVQATVTHWLELLARGDDGLFIEEALTPDELEKVPDLDKLVASFKEDKHDEIATLFRSLRHAKPTIEPHGDRTLVKFAGMRNGQDITFIVERAHVHIQGH